MSERRRRRARKGAEGWRFVRLGPPAPGGFWPTCGHCMRPLSLRRIWRSWRQPAELTYPFRKTDGTREEMPVRWLCSACVRRAEHHRAHEAVLPAR